MALIGKYYLKKTWKTNAQIELPYIPTPMDAIEAIFSFLSKNKLIRENQSLVDLGAGDGRIILYGAKKYHLQSLGLEINSEMIQYINKRIKNKKLGSLCRVEENDLFNFDISSFDIVFSYFVPNVHKISYHVFKQVKTGGIVIGIKWNLDSYKDLWRKKDVIKVEDQKYYVYIRK